MKSIDMNLEIGIKDFLFQCKRLHFVALHQIVKLNISAHNQLYTVPVI